MLGLSSALTAAGEPTEPVTPPSPTNSVDAKQLWLDASRQAAVLNEQVLQANDNVTSTGQGAAEAAQAVFDAEVVVQDATAAVTAAQTELDRYQEGVDRFASASFRGARLSQFSTLLTADSPEDFLDEVSALDRVAADASKTLQAAAQARKDAASTAAALQAAQLEALRSQTEADAAKVAAVAAAADLVAGKAALDLQIADYEALYNQLSESERLQALADEEERNAAAARAAGATVAQNTGTAPVADPMAATGDVQAAAATNQAAQAAVDAALSKVGSAYVWGAAGPNSFDCSGLTSWAWKQAGVSIPRTSGAQNGLATVPLDQLQPGDLVTYYSPVSHVAMYIGNGRVVQASTESKPVYVTDLYRGGPNPTGHRP